MVAKAPKSASREAPKVNVRFRSQKELTEIRRAAKTVGYSLNTFVLEASVRMASEVMQIETTKTKLQQAIDDAFEEPCIRSFLGALSVRNVSFYFPDSLEQASSDLTGMLAGGAYGKGDVFETSFLRLYQLLDPESQKGLRSHFYSKVESAEENFRAEFPKVFRKAGGGVTRN